VQWPDTYPPIFSSRDEFLEYLKLLEDCQAYINGPVIVGCDSFAIYWKGKLLNNPDKRYYGIDMVFLRPGTYQIETVYTEYNSLAFAVDAGIVTAVTPT
jgi:hypothetical protein